MIDVPRLHLLLKKWSLRTHRRDSIRIIYRCWLDGVPYNPALHGAAATLSGQTPSQIAA